MAPKNHLQKIRQKIDAIDREIQKLINHRAECALTVADIKKHEQKNPIYYRPEREAQILRAIIKRNAGPMPNKAMAEIFLQIMAQCRALQNPIKVIFPKENRSIALKAAHKHFGLSIQTEPTLSIRKIFEKIHSKKANYGIIPVEHDKLGRIIATLNHFLEFPVQICGEIIIPPFRFLIIGHTSPTPSGNDKTSLVIFIANKPGSLAHILEPFAKNKIDVTFIEYFPYQGNSNNYVFFVDIAGHQDEHRIKKALQQLDKQQLHYMMLGSYPQAFL